MKYLVKMMVPQEIVVEAATLEAAGKAAEHLRNQSDVVDDGKVITHTVTLLSVHPQNGDEDTQGDPA